MRVLVVGSGGREHALCWHLRKHTPDAEVFCAPGNVGIAQHADLVPIAAEEIPSLAELAADLSIDLTIVGPELPLSFGIVDEFQARDLPIYGPSRNAAQLESSKVFAKQFMVRNDVPTAAFEVVHDAAEAKAAIKQIGIPCVMKADGLAAGKGVLILKSKADAAEATTAFFEERRFGASGDRVLVEPFLEGQEVSFIGFSDGQHLLPLATSKDYKRIGEGDTGLNTGGMGAHSPSGIVAAEQAADVLERVMNRTVAGMAAEGNPFVGVLYAGLMMTSDGPRVLEYNVRLGDPEAQALLMRVEHDLASLLLRGSNGDFQASRIGFSRAAAACIVLAAAGYPEGAEKGAIIEGLDDLDGRPETQVFHAGTKEVDGQIVVGGGRVLNVCARGEGLRQALRNAYDAAALIRWPGMQMRRDIGRQVLEAPNIEHSGIMPVVQPGD